MFPKPHLTSHSRMSGSRCEHSIVIIWVMKTFLYSSSLYSCHPFLISFAFFMSLPFLSFIVPILAWNVPLISPISLNRFHSFPFYCFLLLLCIIHLRRPSYLILLFVGTLNSVGYIFPFLPCLLLLFFPQLFAKPPQTTTLPSCKNFFHFVERYSKPLATKGENLEFVVLHSTSLLKVSSE